jgi:hypothetical protein
MGETYPRLRRLALFLEDFGELLAATDARFPEDNPENPSDFATLRHSQRDNGEAGFVFVNNYQRLHPMQAHPDTTLTANLPGGNIRFPPHTVADRDYFFWPFNLPMGSAMLKMANAVPLCLLRTEQGEVPVFYADYTPTFEWVTPPEHAPLVLSNAQSLEAVRVRTQSGEHLLFSTAFCVQTDGVCSLEGSEPFTFKAWPPLPNTPEGFVFEGEEGGFASYSKACETEKSSVAASLTPLPDHEDGKRWKLSFAYEGTIDGALLSIQAIYNTGELFVDGKLVADSFFFGSGLAWEIDLERYGYPREAELRLTSLKADAPLYLESWPPLPSGEGCEVHSVSAAPVGIVTFRLD